MLKISLIALIKLLAENKIYYFIDTAPSWYDKSVLIFYSSDNCPSTYMFQSKHGDMIKSDKSKITDKRMLLHYDVENRSLIGATRAIYNLLVAFNDENKNKVSV